MLDHCRHLITKWGEGTVILSPRDLKEEQLRKFSTELLKMNGKTLFDPQYYNPKANHKNLTQHVHWFEDFKTDMLSDINCIESQFKEIKSINDYSNTYAYIIPSVLCDNVDKIWIDIQDIFLEASARVFNDKDKYITIALKKEVLLDEFAIEKLVEISKDWAVDGFYIVPEGGYLIENTNWLANLAILVAGLKIQNKKVIIGYSNHQMLFLACSKADAIASGSFLNVRSFNAGKFNTSDEDSISRRSIWYYCPQALSEYRLRALDAAKKEGVLDDLKPYGTTNEYIKTLFSSTMPSTSGFNEKLAFRHYLSELKQQCKISTKGTFQDTLAHHQELLDNSLTFIQQLKKNHVRESGRSFENVIDYNYDALRILEREMGVLLKRKW
ncbi:hypothetical protein CEK71_20010 [Methylovulum psychrotolerans]|uniref:Uncharacterized protein n=2 Tax=Methylovulum psychrotolerans TaxID=1704499 RepID=A0A1Z4C5S6_9GAMM|nr:hypothetical protein CEK71_20010 [Methylovulum psychrotolerans]